MKLRHVRAIAVFGVAMVALTGARGSGGGCSSSGGSSHSSDSGSGTSGDVSTGGSTTGSTSGTSGHDDDSGSGSGGVSVPAGSGSGGKAVRDVRIDACRMDGAGKNLAARITVTNSGTVDYTYSVTVKFRGSGAISKYADVTGMTVPAGASEQGEATAAYTGGGDGSEYTECVVSRASKTAL
ncbi:hypothetical protein [Streptomyces sp. NPDC015131]|uniref:hypothetical protein n=1 Tax=Streptomyces sp. NPDC015131 TaxID=3364941 RepID=UPI0036F52458